MKRKITSPLLALCMVLTVSPASVFCCGRASCCGEKADFGLLGDADGSGEVDYVDAMIVLQYHTSVIPAL